MARTHAPGLHLMYALVLMLPAALPRAGDPVRDKATLVLAHALTPTHALLPAEAAMALEAALYAAYGPGGDPAVRLQRALPGILLWEPRLPCVSYGLGSQAGRARQGGRLCQAT